MTVKNTFLEIIGTDMTVQKGFFENYRGGHDVWADMTTENTVLKKDYNGKRINKEILNKIKKEKKSMNKFEPIINQDDEFYL